MQSRKRCGLAGRARAVGAAAAVVTLLCVGSAGAATVTLSVSGPNTTPLPGGGNGYSLPSVDGLGVGTVITYLGAGDSGGLTVDQNATLKFEFVGQEAGYQNLAVFVGGAFMMDNHGTHNPATFDFGPGTVPFYFKAVDPGNLKANNGGTINSNLLLGFFQVSPTVVYVLFDDGGGGTPSDKDFDDMVLKVTASCPETGCLTKGGGPGDTPLPAAVWLLGSVLAGGAGFGRWRKRKAKRATA